MSCVDAWEAREDWLPGGLAELAKATSTGIYTYIPWFCNTTKYNNAVSGAPPGTPKTDFVSLGQPAQGGIPGNGSGISAPCPWPNGNKTCAFDKALPAPNGAYAFYRALFADFKANHAAHGFEQDFMGQNSDSYGWEACLDCAEKWQRAFADAAADVGLPVQLCLASGADVSLASGLSAVTHARASGDYAGCVGWDIGTSSQMHYAVGIRPFHDVLWTRGRQPGNPYLNSTYNPHADKYCLKPYGQPNPSLDAVIATLSTGPFGIGDGPGLTDASVVWPATDAGSRLLPPDRPLGPTARSLNDPERAGAVAIHTTVRLLTAHTTPGAQDLWAATKPAPVAPRGSDANPLSWLLLGTDLSPADGHVLRLAEEIGHGEADDGDLWPAPAKGTEAFAVWPFVKPGPLTGKGPPPLAACGAATLLAEGQTVPLATQPSAMQSNFTHGWALWTVVPQQANGWLVLGEPQRYAALSGERVSALKVDGSCVSLGLRGDAGEKVRVCAAHASAAEAGGALPLQAFDTELGSDGKGELKIC